MLKRTLRFAWLLLIICACLFSVLGCIHEKDEQNNDSHGTETTEDVTDSDGSVDSARSTELDTESIVDSDSDSADESNTESETAHNHLFGEWYVIAAPTCTDAGVEMRACACGEAERRAIDKLGHEYGQWETVNQPTCTENGRESRKCVCGMTEERILPLSEHEYGEWQTFKAVKCTVDGENRRYCVCGDYQSETVKAVGHIEVTDDAVLPTASSLGYTKGSHCRNCGETMKKQRAVSYLQLDGSDMLSTVTYEGFADGDLTFYWSKNSKYLRELLGIRVTVKRGASVNTLETFETFDVVTADGKWIYKMGGDTRNIYRFEFMPIDTLGKGGKVLNANAYYVPEVAELDIPRVEITTLEGELPTFTKVSPPENCWGGGITDANYVQSVISMYDGENNLLYTSSPFGFSGAKIKVRGNTSAYGSKTPFKIKLNKKYDLLSGLIDREEGIDYRNKDWLLLKTGDNTNVAVGSAVSETVENEWTPKYSYVALFINGDYRGLYILMESVKQGEARCNVSDSGYIIEMDAYWWNEPLYFTTPISETRPAKYTFKYPDTDVIDESSAEYTYIKQYMTDFENVLLGNSEGSIYDYIDKESFVKWLLTHDILSSYDSGGSNMYLLKTDSTSATKVRMGPVWDFDSIYWSRAKYETDHFARIGDEDHFYYRRLLENNEFLAEYRAKYEAARPEVTNAVNDVLAQFETGTYDTLLQYEQFRWGGRYASTAEENARIRQWFSDHLAWMDANVAVRN